MVFFIFWSALLLVSDMGVIGNRASRFSRVARVKSYWDDIAEFAKL